MIEIRETGEFSYWLTDLKDQRAKTKIVARIARLALGNPGDVAPIGEGLSELRIHYGPGYRVYFVQRGDLAMCWHEKVAGQRHRTRESDRGGLGGLTWQQKPA